MNNNYQEIRSCSLCGSDSRTTMYEWPAGYYPHDEYETASWDGRQLIPLFIASCDDCGFVYTAPSFKDEHLGLVYPADLAVPVTDGQSILKSSKWIPILNVLEKQLDKQSITCDIGARYGALVHQMSQRGFNSFGVEYNPEAVRQAEKLGVEGMFQGAIQNVEEIVKSQGLPQVDAFVLDDVLEHLTDPLGDIKRLGEVQSKGGLIVARQMDLDSVGHRFYGKNWYYLQPGAHMGFFNEKSAARLFEQAGYRIVSVHRESSLKQWARLAKRRLMRPSLSKWITNGKTMYLNDRNKLSDMFLVVAAKL